MTPEGVNMAGVCVHVCACVYVCLHVCVRVRACVRACICVKGFMIMPKLIVSRMLELHLQKYGHTTIIYTQGLTQKPYKFITDNIYIYIRAHTHTHLHTH